MNIAQLADKRKEVLNKRFSAEEQNLVKEKFISSIQSVFDDCLAYKESAKYQIDLAKASFEYGIKKCGPHLYDTFEFIIDELHNNQLPYSCNNPLEKIVMQAKEIPNYWYLAEYYQPEAKPFDLIMNLDLVSCD